MKIRRTVEGLKHKDVLDLRPVHIEVFITKDKKGSTMSLVSEGDVMYTIPLEPLKDVIKIKEKK